jgi:STE24 endopeptidase
MSSDKWLFILIFLLVFNYIFSTVLEFINNKNWKDFIPKELKNYYSKEKYIKARNYKKEHGKISFISSTLSTIITLCLLYLGVYGWVSDYFVMNYKNYFIQSALFFLSFFLLNTIVSIPFQYYSTFYIEEKYGFNKTTLKVFITDRIKGILLSILIGGLILFIALFIYQKIENNFWLYLWIFISAFIIFIQMFYTSLIVPLFNKLTPLQEGSLKNKINEYSQKIGYSIDNIFIIDGSKRSTKANAYFSGFGPKKTIALFDTLVEKHTEDELVAVLAHEVGHYKKKHIFQGLVISIFQIGLMTFLLELCLNNEILIKSLGGTAPAFHLGIIIFSFLFSPIGLIMGTLMNMISRKNEFEADNYAKETYNGESLVLALKKLYVDSLSNIYPHPLYVFFHYSHPPLLERIKKIEGN